MGQMIVHGHVKDNRILLDSEIQLPDGTRVEVIVPDTTSTDSESGFMKYAGIWEGLTDEDLGLGDLAERRQNFFGDRKVEP
ncbi:hypothetical protein IH992_12675 [Candidatus Poribacteria bacterium]|nr:hypothetical protein [Candidatus Poribacteria bacterium]